MNRDPLRSLRGSVRGLVLIAVLAFLGLSAWAVASPVGASPDDDFHLASIWCGVGERPGVCEAGDASDEREVLRDLVVTSVCYAYSDETSAGCQGDDFGDDPAETVSTARGNFEGLYPPVYYFVNGFLAGSDIEVSVVAMRLLNALLFVVLIATTYLLLPPSRRGALVGGVVLTVVPLGMFIIASNNPSGWAILSAALLWVSTLGFFDQRGGRRIALGAIATLATVMGAGARADAAIWSVIGIAVAVFIAFRKERRFALSLILPVALVIISALFYLSASQSAALTTGLSDGPPSGGSWLGVFLVNLLNAPHLWVGALGAWGLGWLDTPMPHAVWVGTFGVLVGAAALSLASRDRRVGVAMLGVLGLLFVVPSYILAQSNALVGSYVQPRYILPIMVIFAGLLFLPTARPMRVPPTAVVIGAVVLALANSIALFVNIRRYVTGLDTFSINLDAGVEWWWPAMPSPMTVWVLGSLAFAGAIAGIAYRVLHSDASGGLQQVADDVRPTPARETTVESRPGH